MASEDCFFLESHEWARAEDGLVSVGISDFAVGELSDLVFVDLPEVGAVLKKGERFGEIESVKAVSDLYCPVSGEVVEVNSALADEVEQINDDPFGGGWLIKIKPSDAEPLSGLLSAEDYRKITEAH